MLKKFADGKNVLFVIILVYSKFTEKLSLFLNNSTCSLTHGFITTR